MDCATYLSEISFELIQPGVRRGDRHRFPLGRGGGPDAELLELPRQPIDLLNTRLPGRDRIPGPLRRLCDMPRMSTVAIAAILNHAVSEMPAGEAYVNVGVFAGFSFLSGMLENPDKLCIGVDNFSEFVGAREDFIARFDQLKGPAHRFHEMDYRDYFANVHREPIGVYFYDGDHAYEHQLEGLRIAEPHFADGCIVLVDDTNWNMPRQATIDFVAGSDHEYEVLLDRATGGPAHPTFWNGLLVLRYTGRRSTRAPAEIAASFPPREHRGARTFDELGGSAVSASDRDAPSVSVVLVHDDAGDSALERATEACRAQTWPRVETVVLDRTGSEALPYGGLPEAVSRTRGDLVAFACTATALKPTAVEVAMSLPGGGAPFNRRFGEARYAELERALEVR